MMNYKTDGSKIIENSTGDVIFSSNKKNLIQNLIKRMNNGSGFNDHVPGFFKESSDE